MGTDEFNKKAYDQVLIRFPKGTKTLFVKLFKNEVAFNSWVVNLVVSRLLFYQEYYGITKIDDT